MIQCIYKIYNKGVLSMKSITQLFKNEYIKIADNVINNISIKYKWIIFKSLFTGNNAYNKISC